MSRPFHPTDLFRIRDVGEVVAHPDGQRVAFTQTWMDADKDANQRRLYLWQDGVTRALTSGTSDGTPRFSPDGRYLAFTSGMPPQIQILDLEGGAAITATDFVYGVSEVVWLPDSSGLVVTAVLPPDDQIDVDRDELKRRPRRITELGYRFNGPGFIHDRKTQIFRVPLPDANGDLSEAVQLTSASYSHRSLTISGDGTRLAFLGQPHENADLEASSHILTLGIDGGEPEQMTSEVGIWSNLTFAPDDGSVLAVGYPGRFRSSPAKLHRIDFDGNPTCIDEDDTGHTGFPAPPCPIQIVDNEAYLPAVRHGAIHVDAIDLASGTVRTVLDGNRTVAAFAVTAKDTLFCSSGDETHPLELYSLDDGEEHQLTTLNAEFLEEVELVVPEVVQVQSSEGAVVEAWVTRPPASLDTNGDLPGLVYVHGGPKAHYGYYFLDEFQVAAAQGYVVIGGNPRGSDGYGEDWSTSIVGCIGTIDWDDIQALTQHLCDMPEVDASHVGIGGGSYGGFMTTLAIGRSDRYAAALSERAVNNWESLESSSDIGAWFSDILTGAKNSEDVDRVRAASPMSNVANITTPTLIIHSEDDLRCPIEQAEQLFVRLRMQGVDVEFVRFPGENHELSRSGLPSHRMERFTYIHDWFAKYLGGLEITDLETEDESSDAETPAAESEG